jgi:hypothetical protein
MPEAAQERDVQRASVLALAGFSFTAVAGLAVLDDKVRVSLQLPTWYVLVSFLAYLTCVNLQSYKSTRWQNQLSSALLEIGSLSLILAVLSIIFGTGFSDLFKFASASIAAFSWILDHTIRLILDNAYLRELDSSTRAGKRK